MIKNILGWVGFGAVAVFIAAMFFPTVRDATGNTTIALGNITNSTGLSAGISLTPLLLWLGILCIPLIGIALFLWQRRARAGGG